MMKAVVLETFGGPEALTIKEIPEPVPGPEEIRIRVAASALNRADLLERQGLYPPPGKKPAFQVPGLEVSGWVDAVGDQVTLFRSGDPVMALLSGGGYAEYALSHERLAMSIPSGVPVAEGAAIPEVFLTAFDALFSRGGGRPGDRVLVHAGASGVGSAAIQLARQSGFRVAATVGSQRKLEAAYAFGADRVINYRTEKFQEAVREWSGGDGADVILDFIGQQYLEDNLLSLAPEGTLVLIGTMSGTTAPINLGLVLGRRLKIHGTALRSRPVEQKMALVQAFLHQVSGWFSSGAVKPVIDRAYSLAEIAEAHRYMESNQNIGKILVQV